MSFSFKEYYNRMNNKVGASGKTADGSYSFKKYYNEMHEREQREKNRITEKKARSYEEKKLETERRALLEQYPQTPLGGGQTDAVKAFTQKAVTDSAAKNYAQNKKYYELGAKYGGHSFDQLGRDITDTAQAAKDAGSRLNADAFSFPMPYDKAKTPEELRRAGEDAKIANERKQIIDYLDSLQRAKGTSEQLRGLSEKQEDEAFSFARDYVTGAATNAQKGKFIEEIRKAGYSDIADRLTDIAADQSEIKDSFGKTITVPKAKKRFWDEQTGKSAVALFSHPSQYEKTESVPEFKKFYQLKRRSEQTGETAGYKEGFEKYKDYTSQPNYNYEIDRVEKAIKEGKYSPKEKDASGDRYISFGRNNSLYVSSRDVFEAVNSAIDPGLAPGGKLKHRIEEGDGQYDSNRETFINTAQSMTKEQRGLYNYIVSRSGLEAGADYFFKLFGTDFDEISRQESIKKVEDFAHGLSSGNGIVGNALGGTAATALSVISSLLSGGEYINDLIENAVSGEGMGYNSMADYTNALRNGVMQDMSSDIARMIYQTAASGLDSIAAAWLGNVLAGGLGLTGDALKTGAARLGGGMLGLTAAAQSANDLKERGASDVQVLFGSAASGFFECAFETWSIGNMSIFDTEKITETGIKGILKQIAIETGVNFSEEFNTELAGIIYDTLANGDISNYSVLLKKYMDEGMSYEEARAKVATDFGYQCLEAGLGGALMGFGFGAIGSMKAAEQSRRMGTGAQKTNAANDIISSALADPKAIESQKIAKELKEKIDAGKKISARKLGDLIRAMDKEGVAVEFTDSGAGEESEKATITEPAAPTSSVSEGGGSAASENGRSATNEDSDVYLTEEEEVEAKAEEVNKILGKYARSASDINTEKVTESFAGAQDDTLGGSQVSDTNEIRAEIRTAEGTDSGTVGRIVKSEDGLMLVEVTGEDGKTQAVPLKDVHFDDSDISTYGDVYHYAVMMNDESYANILTGNYDGKTDAMAYIDNMSNALNAGIASGNIDGFDEWYASLPADQKKAPQSALFAAYYRGAKINENLTNNNNGIGNAVRPSSVDASVYAPTASPEGEAKSSAANEKSKAGESEDIPFVLEDEDVSNEDSEKATITEPAAPTSSDSAGGRAESPSPKRGRLNSARDETTDKTAKRIAGKMVDRTGKLTQETRGVLTEFARHFGVDVDIVDRIEGGALGKYSITDGVQRIVVALEKNNNPVGTFIHETVHMIRALSKNEFLNLYACGMKYLALENGKSEQQIIAEIKEKYKEKNVELTPAEAREEAVAMAYESITASDNIEQKLAEVLAKAQTPERLQILDGFKKFVGTIKKWFDHIMSFVRDELGKQKYNSEYSRNLANNAEKVEKLLDSFASALDELAEMNRTGKLAEVLEGKTVERNEIVRSPDGKLYVKASRNVITGKTVAEMRKNITAFFNQLLDGQKSIDIKTVEGDILTITKKETAKKARDNFKLVKKQHVKMDDAEFAVKLRAEAHIDELSKISKDTHTGMPDEGNHPFAKDGFTYRRTYFEDFDGQYYIITLSIGHNKNIATVYNVGKIEEDTLPSAQISAVEGSKAHGKESSNALYTNKTKKSRGIEKNSFSFGDEGTNEDTEKATGSFADAQDDTLKGKKGADETHEERVERLKRKIETSLTQRLKYEEAITKLRKSELLNPGGKVVDEGKEKRFLRKMLKDTGSSLSFDSFSDQMRRLYDMLSSKKGDDSDYFRNAAEYAERIAEQVLDNVREIDRAAWDEIGDIRRDLKHVGIYISPSAKAEIEHRFGSYKNFRSAVAGKIKLSTNRNSGYLAPDEMWNAYSEQMEAHFGDVPNEYDKLFAFVQLLEENQPVVTFPYLDAAGGDAEGQLYYSEAVSRLARELIASYAERPYYQTIEGAKSDAMRQLSDEIRRAISDKNTGEVGGVLGDVSALIRESENAKAKSELYKKQLMNKNGRVFVEDSVRKNVSGILEGYLGIDEKIDGGVLEKITGKVFDGFTELAERKQITQGDFIDVLDDAITDIAAFRHDQVNGNVKYGTFEEDKQYYEEAAAALLNAYLESDEHNTIKGAYEAGAKKGWREKQAAYREARERTDRFGVLKRLWQRMANRINKPTEQHFAPASRLTDVLYDTLQLINVKRNEAPTQFNAKIDRMSIELDRYMKEYSAKTNGTNYGGNMFSNDVFAANLKEELEGLREMMNGRSIFDLNSRELDQIINVMRGIDGLIQNQTTAFIEGKRVEIAKNALRAHDEIASMRPEEASKFKRWVWDVTDGYQALMNTPMRVIRKMSAYNDEAVLNVVMRGFEKGYINASNYVMKNSKAFESLVSDKKEYGAYRNDLFVPRAKNGEALWYDKYGHEVKITRAFANQLILSWYREMSDSRLIHLQQGGAVIPDAKLLNEGKTEKAFRGNNAVIIGPLSQSDIDALEEYCNSEYDVEWRKKANEYFNKNSVKALDYIYRHLYGRHFLPGREYIPFKVADNYIGREITALQHDVTLMNAGMLKDLQSGSIKPLAIVGLDRVVEENIKQVGRLYGYALPVDTFNKTWNYVGFDESGTLRNKVKNVYGPDIVRMIEDVVADAQRDRKGDVSIFDRLTGNTVRSLFNWNPYIAIKQMASYDTAGAFLSKRALYGLTGGNKYLLQVIRPSDAAKLDELIDKYTPLLYNRRQGLISTEMAAMSDALLSRSVPQSNQKLRKITGIADGIRQFGGKWIQFMDVTTVRMLWLASEREIQLQGKHSKGTGEYYKATAELFNRVVNETQPNYNYLYRPEIQKSQNKLLRIVSLFKTNQLQMRGLLEDSLGESRARGAEYKKAQAAYDKNPSEENRQKLERAKKQASESGLYAARSTSGVILSALKYQLLSVLASFILAGRKKQYEDEDGEITWQSVGLRMLLDSGETFFASLSPIGAGFLDLPGYIAQFGKEGESWYGISGDLGFEQISSVLTYGSYVIKDITKTASDENVGNVNYIAQNLDNHLMPFIRRNLALFGVPADNIHNIAAGLREIFKSTKDGQNYFTEAGTAQTNAQMYDAMFEAYLDGDGDKVDKYEKWLKEGRTPDKTVAGAVAGKEYGGQTFEQIDSAMISRLRDQDDIIAAAGDLANGRTDHYDDVRDKYIVGLGFKHDVVVKAISQEQAEILNRRNPKEKEDIDLDDTQLEYRASDVASAVAAAVENDTYNTDQIADMVYYLLYEQDIKTVTDKSIRQTITRKIKPIYLESSPTKRREIEDLLTTYCTYPYNYDFGEWLEE